MAILEDIEEGASGQTMSLGELLRKCLVLASRLNSQPAIDWVEWELNGYPSEMAVPDYRIIHVSIKANMSDFTRQVTSWSVPPLLLGDHAENWTRVNCRDSVGSLEHLIGKSEETLSFHLGDLPLFLRSRKFTNMEITSAWGECSSSRLAHILETVRTRVLKFALELGKAYPNAGSANTDADRHDRVNQIFVNNIYGNANVVGTANHSHITLNVTQGDFASLSTALQQRGVSDEDIKELKAALRAEPTAKASGFGPRVAGWVGKMIAKAADGSWGIATSAAADLLSKALSSYYGFG